jgi:NAD(P)H-dependent flavin oxidoreductase YrpB (nitropropane dioxygenase family)
MVLKTNITEMLGIKHPIIQAPMGGTGMRELALAVSESGGIGIVGHDSPIGSEEMYTISRRTMKERLLYLAEHTDKPFGVNIRTTRVQRDAEQMCKEIPEFIMSNPKIKEQCVYIVTSAGSSRVLPQSKSFQKLKESGSNIKHFHVAPALWLADKCIAAGVDGLVCTGSEGGGHQSYEQLSTLVLLQQFTEKYPDVPLIACGGFATGQGLAAALSMGAGAIVMGSRFLASNECQYPDAYKNIIPPANAEDTVIVTGMLGPIRLWKNKYSLEHKFLKKEEKIAREKEMTVNDMIEEASHYGFITEKNIQDKALLLGQSAGLVENIESAKDIIEKIVSEAEKRLKQSSTYVV